MKKYIPNLFTLLNLTLGGLGTIWALQGHLPYATLCLWLGALCDFLDGLLARLLEAHSPLGKQLDSFADLLTFGWLPASIMYMLIGQQNVYLPYIVLFIPASAALRLARFNLDTQQQRAFSGLPTPAQGLLISTLPLILTTNKYPWLTAWLAHPYTLAGLTVLVAYLMVAPIQFIAFKFATYAWYPNRFRYGFLLAATALVLLLRVEGLALSIVGYIVSAVYRKRCPKSTEARR